MQLTLRLIVEDGEQRDIPIESYYALETEIERKSKRYEIVSTEIIHVLKVREYPETEAIPPPPADVLYEEVYEEEEEKEEESDEVMFKDGEHLDEVSQDKEDEEDGEYEFPEIITQGTDIGEW